MGDVLSSIFGGGQKTSQTTKPDWISQALNFQRLQQMNELFNQGGIADFANARPDLFSMSPELESFISEFTGGSNRMSLDEYVNMGLDEMSNYISQVATPEIMSQMALMGLETGGSVPTAIAKATAGIGLPFMQSIPSFMSANTQQGTSMFPMLDYPQQLARDDFSRQQNFMSSMFTGLPFTPGGSQKGGTSSQPLFNFFGQG